MIKHYILCCKDLAKYYNTKQYHFFFMNTLSRVIVTLIAVISVGALGYYAYTLSSRTLTLPFSGSEKQYGDTLILPVSPPSLRLGASPNMLLDPTAVESSLMKGGVVFQKDTLS